MKDAPSAWPILGPLRLGLVALLILVAGFGGWSVLTQISGAVVASGQIEVDRNRQAIQHPEGGIVAELLVAEGERVAEGQILLRLDPADLATDLAVTRTRLAELRARILQVEARITALEAQEAALAEQIALVAEELARREDLLGRGSGTREPVVRLQQELSQLRGALAEAAAGRAEAAERIIETELAILQLADDRREQAITELRELRVAEQELGERAANLALRIGRLDLRAPMAGHIHGLAVFGSGAVLRPAEPFTYLVPEGRPLVISARVPAIHIDQVFAGQPVSLRFPAFDQRDLPEVTGRVAQVSADVFIDEDARSGFYRVQIVMAEDQAARLGPNVLVPGMPVEAFIRTADRTPLAYLLDPFTTYFVRAFRET